MVYLLPLRILQLIKCVVCLIFVFFCFLYVSVVQSKAAKMLSLSPLKCTGKVSIKSISKVDCSLSYDAVFLCKSGKLEVIEENELNSNSVTICDVVPLVLDYNPLFKDGKTLSHHSYILYYHIQYF